MKYPENDICLTPGGRYMVEPAHYEAHLQEAVDYREVSFVSAGLWYVYCVFIASEIYMFQSQGSQ